MPGLFLCSDFYEYGPAYALKLRRSFY